MFDKHFTPQEANQRLPLVKKIVADILVKGKVFRDLIESVKEESEIPKEIYTLKDEITDLMDELEQLGCFFKDWNFAVGLVDFPAIIDNREVLLCWRSDEEEVRYFHSVDDGYASRQPIPERLLAEVNQ